MPKTGTISCDQQDCAYSTTGTLPDSKFIGETHTYINPRDNGGITDLKLFEDLKDHHKATQVDIGSGLKSSGHKNYEVKFNDGTKGEIQANLYAMTFKETRG